ncbi:MAG: copper resistance protein CopC [Rhodospirillales bacterium]|nr:copper resistance protein CopC [Rhodospirillales bacterium]MDE0712068.1 copper resistance protein CopC [Rhodospirillales bacterium]
MSSALAAARAQTRPGVTRFTSPPETTSRRGAWHAIPSVCALVAAVVLVAAQASAESLVEHSNIVAGDVLDTAPAAFEIRFAQRVMLDQASLQLDSGDIVELTVPSPMTERATFAIPLPELRDGDYVLNWRITVPGDRVTHARVDFIVVGYHDHSEHDHSDHSH